MAEQEPIRIVIADDHGVMRAALRALLEAEPDLVVVGEAGNGADALAMAERLHPDVVLMDLTMPVMDGLQATAQIVERIPDCRVLVLTMHAEEQYLFDVLQAGGSGYLLKQAADEELATAVRAVARGDAFLYPSGIRLLLSAYMRGERRDQRAGSRESLSEREEQVLALTAGGFSNHEIAERLYLSTKTVDTYRQRIMEKLQLQHRSELVHYALDRGLLKPQRSEPAAL